MAGLGFFLTRLGWRWTMIFGILGHVLRFLVYSLGGPLWLVVGSNVVHGFCYAFFFASVYIFVDEYFPKDARASAQGLFNFLILGLGPVRRKPAVGPPGRRRTARPTGVDFSKLFLVPSGLGLAGRRSPVRGLPPGPAAPRGRAGRLRRLRVIAHDAQGARWGSGSSAAGSSPASTCRSWIARARRGRARRLEPQPRSGRRRRRPWRARCAWARRGPSRRIEEMVAAPEIDCIWLCGPNHARVENMERIVDAARPRRRARGHRLREAAGPQRGRGAADGRAGREGGRAPRLPRGPALRARRSRAHARSPGRAAPRSRAGPTWRAPPRSTAGRTCRGSGGATCRAAACSTT